MRLSEVDYDATDLVQQRAPSAEPVEDRYVMITFEMRYNGGMLGETAFSLVPELVGTDGRSYSAVDCSTGLSIEATDSPGLHGEDSGQYGICFDVPSDVIGDDARVVLRMNGVLDELYWQP